MNPQYAQQQQSPYGAPPVQGYGGPQPPMTPNYGPPPPGGPGGMPPMMGNIPRPYGPPVGTSPAPGVRPGGPPLTPQLNSPFPGQAPPRATTPSQLAHQMAGLNVGQNPPLDGGMRTPVGGPPNPLLYPPSSTEVNGAASPAGQYQFQTPQQRPMVPPMGMPTPGMPPKPQPPMQQVPQQFQNGAGPMQDNSYLSSQGGAAMNGPYGAPGPQQMASPAQPGLVLPPYQSSPYGAPPAPQQQQQLGYPGQSSMANRYPPGGDGYTPGLPQQPVQQPQQPRRLDPDQMPSPIQVMEDDKKTRSGTFYTNTRGQVPPLVTTPFTTQDQGNSGPRFIRSSMYSIPVQPDMMKQTAVPFSLVISPFAELESGELKPPVVDMGQLGPVRCVRCKAYMCPYMQFVDGGRRFQCPFCKATTEVPAEYFEHLDHTGSRLDKYRRPELCLGSYEFIATKDYCRNNVAPKPPAYIFVIDVSYNNVKSGLVHLLCQNMKSILQQLPAEGEGVKSSAKVGFITYGHEVHFYNIKPTLAQPQMMVVGDVQDMFMPLLDGFLCDVSESEAVIDQLMVQIPAQFADSRETETILGPALQAGLEALKAAECSGKLLVFHSSLPIAEAPGKLKNRDDRKLLGTEKEKTILAPQSTFYNQIGQECAAAGCSVDMFIFNNAYIDLATIGQTSRLTGGQVYKYTYFQAELDGERLLEDAKRSVNRTVAFDTVMRVRTSTGVRPVDFYGHFFMSNTTDVEMAAIDRDKAVTVEVKHDDKLTDEDGVYIQVAVLYTSVGGQRRLRIHNLSLNVCSQMADLYRSCDLDTIMNLLLKQSVTKLTEKPPKALRDGLINRSAQMLACYRKNCASPSSPGQLILPECMKLLPLYINCLMKSDALCGGADITTDERTFNMYAVQTMDVASTLAYLYPRLIPLHDAPPTLEGIPAPIRGTVEKLRDDGVYVLENGIHMFLWIGLAVNPDWIHQVFGVQSAAQIDIDRSRLMETDNPLSQQVRAIIARVTNSRPRQMKLTFVRQRDKLDIVFKKFLVEDRHSEVSLSYVDFLCHLHKEIRNLLN